MAWPLNLGGVELLAAWEDVFHDFESTRLIGTLALPACALAALPPPREVLLASTVVRGSPRLCLQCIAQRVRQRCPPAPFWGKVCFGLRPAYTVMQPASGSAGCH